jgi:hypothetical protein
VTAVPDRPDPRPTRPEYDRGVPERDGTARESPSLGLSPLSRVRLDELLQSCWTGSVGW